MNRQLNQSNNNFRVLLNRPVFPDIIPRQAGFLRGKPYCWFYRSNALPVASGVAWNLNWGPDGYQPNKTGAPVGLGTRMLGVAKSKFS